MKKEEDEEEVDCAPLPALAGQATETASVIEVNASAVDCMFLRARAWRQAAETASVIDVNASAVHLCTDDLRSGRAAAAASVVALIRNGHTSPSTPMLTQRGGRG